MVSGPRGVGVSALLTAVARGRRAAGSVVDHRVATDPLDDLLGGADAPRSSSPLTAELPVLVLDDVHKLGDTTATQLRRAVLDGRLRCLLGSTRPERLAAPLEWLWQSGTLDRVDVDALDAATVAAWIENLVGAPPDRSTLEVLLGDSGGLPGLLVDTLAALTQAGPDAGLTVRLGYARLAGALPCPVGLQRRVHRRAHGLEPEAREVLAAACVTGRLGPAMWNLPSVAGSTDELTRRGLLAWAGPPEDRWLGPAVGAVRRAVLADLGPLGIGRTAARLLADTPDPRPIDHQLWVSLAEPPPQAGDRPPAVSVARQLLAQRRLDEAEIVARAAADQGDLAATVVLAELRSERADWSGSAALLTALLDRAGLDDDLRVLAVDELASLWLWNFDWADRAIELARDTAARTGGLGGPATGALVEISVQAGRIDEAVALAAELEAMAHSPTVKTQASVALALALAGQLDRGVVLARDNLARCLNPSPGVTPEDPETTLLALALGLTEHGQVAEAAELGATGYELVSSHPTDFAWMALARGRVAVARGELGAAEAYGREAEVIFGEFDDLTPWLWALAIQLYVAGVSGQPRRCRDLLARMEALGPSGVAFLAPDLARARAWADHAQGDTLGARRRLVEAAADAATVGNRTLALVVWHDALRLGERNRAPAALRELVAQVVGTWSAAVAAHLDARASKEPAAWLAAAEAMAEAGRTVETAELAAEAMAEASRRSDRAVMRTARAVFDAAVVVCRGASTPRLATGAASLTHREREVAQLAAGGAASRRIAAELGISVRTVDNLLGRAYAKLGIRRRRELSEALDPD